MRVAGIDEVNKSFIDGIVGVSYAGRPIDNTCMYISGKVGRLIENLGEVYGCIVFIDKEIEVPEDIVERNCYITTSDPQMEYARFVGSIAKRAEELNKKRKYKLTEDGYYIGENVIIGKNAYIEPACFIGHDVRIGDDARILSGARIRNAVIGNGFIAGENCTIGTYGFTMTADENGNKMRIPTLGRVMIGDNAEVGALTNISAGSAGDTVIHDNVKLDALVHIGHDAELFENVEITAGVIVGGFDILHSNAYAGINSTLRNRINIGVNSIIGMGAVVTKNVGDDQTVVGNPAKTLIKK